MPAQESLPPSVDPKVRSVVLFFAYRNHHPIPSTRLMKLAYLAEVRSVETRGHRLTNANFKHWHYGPFSPDVALAMEGIPELTVEVKESSRGEGRFLSPAQRKVKVDLTKEEIAILESVLRDWQYVDSETLVASTKRSPPFVWTDFGDPIPFGEYASFVSRMRKARNDDLGRSVRVLESSADVAGFVKAL